MIRCLAVVLVVNSYIKPRTLNAAARKETEFGDSFAHSKLPSYCAREATVPWPPAAFGFLTKSRAAGVAEVMANVRCSTPQRKRERCDVMTSPPVVETLEENRFPTDGCGKECPVTVSKRQGQRGDNHRSSVSHHPMNR
jgi:hypothetical protein